jgi:hypothetical protein
LTQLLTPSILVSSCTRSAAVLPIARGRAIH